MRKFPTNTHQTPIHPIPVCIYCIKYFLMATIVLESHRVHHLYNNLACKFCATNRNRQFSPSYYHRWDSFVWPNPDERTFVPTNTAYQRQFGERNSVDADVKAAHDSIDSWCFAAVHTVNIGAENHSDHRATYTRRVSTSASRPHKQPAISRYSDDGTRPIGMLHVRNPPAIRCLRLLLAF